MRYEYMKEYETNGQRPEGLADYVFVHVMFDGKWEDWGEEHNAVENWDWVNSQKFRIVDERFKPASDTDVGTNWYESGARVSFPTGKGVLVVSEPDCSGVVVVLDEALGEYKRVAKDSVKPIGTERDNLIEKATAEVCEYTNEIAESARYFTITTLIEADWRPIKQHSEDEFLKQATKKGIYKDTAEYLYRVGCRFIEQGE